jgi:hypothetical protein
MYRMYGSRYTQDVWQDMTAQRPPDSIFGPKCKSLCTNPRLPLGSYTLFVATHQG